MNVLKIIICACCTLSVAIVSAQTTIRLNINHLFNEEVVQQGGVYSTGPGDVDLRVDRLQYYMSEFMHTNALRNRSGLREMKHMELYANGLEPPRPMAHAMSI